MVMSPMDNLSAARSTFMLEKVGAIVAAYVSRNAIDVGALPALIDQVHSAIAVLRRDPSGSGAGGLSQEQVDASIQEAGLISFIDGRAYQTLKRHLTAHGLTPERYRAKYGLPADYPMVAPGYAARRSEIARAIQLGHKAG
ncbi:transcriptional regulatory protein MucR [Methylobacterium phyllosphaerae]|jgi:predicted transcriptional regulator|uniref:Predicted transcriptional regulator n=3 Tax=Methylobacterium TaxID=407 RepID=A0AAE8HUK9_9HYPH|nr:transcriptional regulatory protein MucR [Methylobacterium phyllosphaerae]AWV16160.1 MucR family transcriptional regulator [Methylobacterium sp. XJLW]KOX58222.1 MucR family transcriptional regulator [Streptomyces purpurogeneiscleroticus]SFH27596.1 Predicted transcriptional regulator [Methylobacterium phyllosphaerae]SFV04599.1 transcriptional regulator, MucR family [Methylobacterium sp. UNCCL125]